MQAEIVVFNNSRNRIYQKVSVKMNGNFKRYLNLFFVFFKIGAFTIGGGLAMLPIIQNEFCVKNKWVDQEEIVDIFAICQSLPGVIAINSSIYVGYKVGGMRGAVVSAVGVILPSFLIISVIALFFDSFAENVYVKKAFTGVIAGIVGMLTVSAAKLGKSAIHDVFGIVLAVIAFLVLVFFDCNVVLVILAGALVANIFYALVKRKRGTKV